VPIVIPQRVTPGLIHLLREFVKPIALVLHSNHAQELDGDVHSACRLLREISNLTLLNQSVLLRDVNDNVEALEQLSQRLFECGVLPYYLHQLDRVTGTRHFEVPAELGKQLVQRLRERLPGYLVPRYVQEIPGRDSKTSLM
jgi:KamA family protein